jgi:hypothetical protein
MPVLGIVLLLAGSTAAAGLLQIAWYSRTLPQPDRGRLGAPAEQGTRTVIHTEWPLLGEQRDDPGAWRQFTEIRESINTQQPVTGGDQARYQGALEAVAQLGDARRERVNEAATAGVPELPWVALLIVYAFNYPFSGPLKVAPTAFRLALERMRAVT